MGIKVIVNWPLLSLSALQREAQMYSITKIRTSALHHRASFASRVSKLFSPPFHLLTSNLHHY